jgi:hypothetical protein
MDTLTRRKFLRAGSASAAGLMLGHLAPVAATASPTLVDFWAGRAKFVVEVETFGGAFGMHFLSAVPIASGFYAYYIKSVAGRAGVGVARTSDGRSFHDLGAVLDTGPAGSWDARMASFPGVLKNGASWFMTYEGAGSSPGDIGLATSGNGLTWSKRPSPLLRHAVRQPGDGRGLDLSWERQNIGTPSLWLEGGRYHLFYHGFGRRVGGGPDDCQVGVAIGTSLDNLVRYSGNPVLRTGGAGAWDAGTIGKRSILREGAYYYMVYEGSTDQPYDRARWSTGLARSHDLLNWEKFPRPVLPVTGSGFGYDGPEWLRLPGGLYIYFRLGATKRAKLVFNR